MGGGGGGGGPGQFFYGNREAGRVGSKKSDPLTTLLYTNCDENSKVRAMWRFIWMSMILANKYLNGLT